MVQSLNDDGDRGKIKEQKYPENAVKNKSIVRTNLSCPSLKENVEKCHQTKISINNSAHSSRQVKYKVIIKLFSIIFL